MRYLPLISILVALALAPPASAASFPTLPSTIWTIAGNGEDCSPSTGPCGDGPDALAAQVDTPEGIARDAAGNLFVAENGSHKIRRITPAGAISTVAGSGAQCSNPTGTCGDGPNALAAQLNNPQGVAVDAAGNVYIADRGDRKVRKVTPGGAITTIAGNGTPCANPVGT